MSREQAKTLLNLLIEQQPRDFFSHINEEQRGIGFVLGYLYRQEEEVSAGDLAREMGVSSARIARLLNAMEKKELVERRRSAADARKTIVVLTGKGLDSFKMHREQLLVLVEDLIETVGMEDLLEFIRICHKIKRALPESAEPFTSF